MPLKHVYARCSSYINSPYASYILSFLFFIEAIFFIPVDPLLIMYCLEQPRHIWRHAALATVSSVAGGIAAYCIGASVWNTIGSTIVSYCISPTVFNNLCAWYTQYESWAVLIAGFTPVPYKVVTLSAGFCRLPIIPFILYSLIARGARFFLITALVHRYGEFIKQAIDRYLELLVLLFIILILGTGIISLR